MDSEKKIENSVQEKGSGLIRIVLAFAWRDRGKLRKRARNMGVQNRHLPQ
jgi:hypothetical protein